MAAKERMKQLLKEQYLRTKIAGDLHDEVGSTLTRICFHADRLSATPEAPLMAKQIAGYSREAGLTNKEIAIRLDISLETVKSHIKNIYRKLEVNSRHLLIKGSYRK